MFKITPLTVIIGLGSLALGYYLNRIAEAESRKKLIAELKKEIEILLEKQNTARITPDESKRINELQGAISVLENKRI